MPGYRLYDFREGHIVKARTLDAEDDAEAIEKGRALAGDQTAELWEGPRKVKIFNAPAPSS